MLTSPRISRVLVTFCDLLVFLKLPVGSPVLPISLVRQPSKQPKSSLQDSIIFSLIERSQYRVNSWRPNTKNWIPNQFAFPLGVGFKNNVFLVYLGKWSTLTIIFFQMGWNHQLVHLWIHPSRCRLRAEAQAIGAVTWQMSEDEIPPWRLLWGKGHDFLL